MSYDYEKTSLTLYRAVFKANYDGDVGRYLHPDKELAEAAEVAPLLHPTFDSPTPLASPPARRTSSPAATASTPRTPAAPRCSTAPACCAAPTATS